MGKSEGSLVYTYLENWVGKSVSRGGTPVPEIIRGSLVL